MKSTTELRALLEENVYIIKQYINTLPSDIEKTLPLKVYSDNLKALHSLEPEEQPTEQTSQELIKDAGKLLINFDLLNENQVNHYKNRPLIDKCNNFIIVYGVDRFVDVLTRIKNYRDAGKKINNVQAFLNRALDNESKASADNE